MTAQAKTALDDRNTRQSGYFTLPLITGLTALGSVSVSIYLPSLPNIGLSLHASSELVKLSLSVFLFVFAASQVVYGPLSDRFGRRPPILIGLAIYLLGTASCALASTAGILVASRAIQALGAAAGPALGRAMLRDLYSAEKLTSSLALVAAAVALSPMLGPVLGGYLQVTFGWRACFLFLLAGGLVLLAAGFAMLPETAGPKPGGLDPKSIVDHYKTLLTDQEYVSALLCGGLLTAGNFAWTAGAPYFFENAFGFSPDRYGNVALVIGMGYVVGTLLSGRLSRHLLAPQIVYFGLTLTLLGSFSLNWFGPQTASYLPVCAVVVLFTIGMGIVIPMSAACALSRHPEIAGAAAGLLGALQIFTGALGTTAISFTRNPTASQIAHIMEVTSVFALPAAYVALKPFRQRLVSARESLA